jgi:hypothetical protein
VLCQLLAASNPGVKTFGYNVRQSIINDDFDPDVRISRQELDELRQQDRICGIFGGGDPNGACGLVSKFTKRHKLSLDLLNPRRNRIK